MILADDPTRVADAIAISRRTLRLARQSIWAGLGLSGVGMVAASLGWLPPVAGALLQEGIDVAVILNALRASFPPEARGEPHPLAYRRRATHQVPRRTAPAESEGWEKYMPSRRIPPNRPLEPGVHPASQLRIPIGPQPAADARAARR